MHYLGLKCALKTITINGASTDRERLETYQNELFAYGELYSNQIIKYCGYSVQYMPRQIDLMLLTEFMDGGTINDVIVSKRQVSSFYPWNSNYNCRLIIKQAQDVQTKSTIHKTAKE